jgi:hypothetical protein
LKHHLDILSFVPQSLSPFVLTIPTTSSSKEHHKKPELKLVRNGEKQKKGFKHHACFKRRMLGQTGPCLPIIKGKIIQEKREKR